MPKNRVALSNMVSTVNPGFISTYIQTFHSLPCLQDVKETRDVSEDIKAVVFNRTPIMSTYLLAFIVGEYEYVEDTDANGILVRVYTPLGKKEQGR